MIEFRGTYFDGITSKAHKVLIKASNGVLLVQAEGKRPLKFPLQQCLFTPPLGNTVRSINLPGGALCETDDVDAIAKLEENIGRNRGLRIVHFMESRWKTVAGCSVALIFCVWGFIAYGIPFMAKKAAFAVPIEISEVMSRETIKILDKQYLKPTKLSPERRGELRKIFKELLPKGDTPFKYKLEFRKSAALGPNAFALPSGLILMTDELVALAEDDRELAGILMHEAAHVEERHGLRGLFQKTGVFLLISILVGDVASITSTAATLPTLLAESGYSRQFEKEADHVAGLYCIEKGWTTKPLQNILQRIAKRHANLPALSIISTHPLTVERVKALQSLE